MKCKRCGTELKDDAKYCPACGYPDVDYKVNPNFCPNCGQSLIASGSACPSCGWKAKGKKNTA